MKNKFASMIIITTLVFSSYCCENNNVEDPSALEPVSITTSNVNLGNIYFNLDDNSEVQSTGYWHLAIIIDTANYNMPSILMGEVSVAVYEDLLYPDIFNIPSSYNSDIQINNSVFLYGGELEILSYDIQVHKASVHNPNKIYIIRSKNNEKTYKLQFIGYLSGITVFQYNELPLNS